jgi:hypothetical protein
VDAANYWGNGGDGNLDPMAQIAVAQRVAARYFYPGYVPDQNGCAAW